MPNQRKRAKSGEKQCYRCFAYVPAGTRKCKFCGNKFKSTSKYLFDTIKRVLRIDRAFTVDTAKTLKEDDSFFTRSEIETVLNFKNIRILMFITLDNLTMIDEMALIELGEMLIKIDTYSAVVK